MLVPKMTVVRKEEGATAAASHLPSLTAGWLFRWFVGPSGSKQRNPNHWERLINYRKCPNYETNNCSDKCSNKRRRFLDIHSDSPNQMKQQMKQNAAESENRLTKNSNK